MEELNNTIRLLQEALTTTQDHTTREMLSNELVHTLNSRYLETNSLSDLEEAIQVLQSALGVFSQPGPDRAILLHNLSTVLQARHTRLGAAVDLENAIKTGRDALETTPQDEKERVLFMRSLGQALNDRYVIMGSIDDLTESIQLARRVIALTSKDHPDRGLHLDSLANGLGQRFSRTGSTADIDESIQIGSEALEAIPGGHHDRPGRLNNLGLGYNDRYLRTGQQSDLEHAMHMHREAVDLTPESHRDRAMFLNNFGLVLSDWYRKTGLLSYLDEAIQASRDAVAITPKDHPDWGGRLCNLGDRLDDRYFRTGAIADLEEAIESGQQALKATGRSHPERPDRLNNLSITLQARYTLMGAICDLDESIQLVKEAIEIMLEGHPNRLMSLNNLVNRFGDKYSRTEDLDDLDEAIRFGQAATSTIPPDHPDRAILFNNLSYVLGTRYSVEGELQDLNEAIRIGRMAVEATSDTNPNRAVFLNTLGVHIGNRYLETRDEDDLEYSIKLIQEAVDATPLNHPNKAIFWNALAVRLRDRYVVGGAVGDLESAISSCKSTLFHDDAQPGVRMEAGKMIFGLLAHTSDWDQAYEAATRVMSLIAQLTPRSHEHSDRQYILSELAGFSSQSAVAALNAGKGPFAALQLLEQGRGVIAASLEDLRIEIMELREKHPNLADKFDNCRAKLEIPVPSTALVETHQDSWQPQGSQRYEIGKEFDNVISEIRSKPGFEGFLLAPTDVEVHSATRHGPIVVINVSVYRCDAIIIEQCKIRQIPLPDLNFDQIEEMIRLDRLGSPKVLKWLWNAVASPILAALGMIEAPSDQDTWPHIWWVPTGPLTKFPLHAAGYHEQNSNNTVLDRAMSSYSSSVKAIILGRQRPITPSSEASRAVLVALERTPGCSPLPFAGREVSIVQNLCRSMALEVVQPPPHKQDILSQLPQCKIFHFAGHGSNNADPSMSQLRLEDTNNSISLANLLELNLRRHTPFLAYLSACGTGEIEDEKYFDEGLHLISGCQLAGFRHVIGTLWEVNDETCLDMARITYEGMSHGGITDESLCRGLHRAVREMRDRWLQSRPECEHENEKHKGMSTIHGRDDTVDIDAGLRDDQLARNVILMADENEEDEVLRWVPYVHYGV